jgi:tRNA-Thr(GGU) m(6)t(6)A37 methyltransferase TsaA
MVGISAQVSFYPLRQAVSGPAIDNALAVFRQHELEVEPGPMSILISGEDIAVFQALQRAFEQSAQRGEVVMVVTFSNACPIPSKEEQAITFTAIGYVENQFDEPVSSEEIRAVESRIVLNPDLVEGMQGLEPGQQLLVVFHFHRTEGFNLLQHPRGDRSRPRRGVFALCSPQRPNPIGVTVVDLLAIQGNILRVRGLDAINGTPVLDLKPA